MNVTEKFGLGVKNGADQLMDFYKANKLSITNTSFKQPNRLLYTWTSPDGLYRNEIEYVIRSRRWRSYIPSEKLGQEQIVALTMKLCISNMRVKLKKSNKRITAPKYNVL